MPSQWPPAQRHCNSCVAPTYWARPSSCHCYPRRKSSDSMDLSGWYGSLFKPSLHPRVEWFFYHLCFVGFRVVVKFGPQKNHYYYQRFSHYFHHFQLLSHHFTILITWLSMILPWFTMFLTFFNHYTRFCEILRYKPPQEWSSEPSSGASAHRGRQRGRPSPAMWISWD